MSFTYKTFYLKRLLTSFSAATVEREEVQMVCAGKEFRLPVYSTSRMVTFTPNYDGPRRVLLDKTTVSGSVLLLCFCLFAACTDFQNSFTVQLQVKDPRFKWTRDRMLVLKEVTHGDEGLYAIKLFSGFTYETVRLTVSGTIDSFYSEIWHVFCFVFLHSASPSSFIVRE